MSPLRICDEIKDLEYNVSEQDLVRLSYSLGSVLYAVRGELSNLHVWCTEPHQIGSQLISVFGQQYYSLCNADSNQEAASLLRKALIGHLGSVQFADAQQRKLSDKLVALLQAEEDNPVDDPFLIVFRTVANTAKDLFGEDWPSEVRCRFEVLGASPYPNSPFWINAYTILDADVAVPPCVCLRIHPHQLNFETYSAVYALLVHEFFCHVPAYRAKQTNESPFSEGLCDWAAYELFTRWLRRLDSLLADAARQFGQQIWILMTTRDGGNKFWRHRELGHKAAERLVRLFMEAGATDQEAIDLAITLARELVVVGAPLADKDSFVRNLMRQATEEEKARLESWRAGRAAALSLLRSDP